MAYAETPSIMKLAPVTDDDSSQACNEMLYASSLGSPHR